MTQITSFPSSVQAGGFAVITATASGCLDITYEVAYNGVILGSPPVGYSCHNGTVTIKIDPAPALVQGEMNVLSVVINQGSANDSCDIQVT